MSVPEKKDTDISRTCPLCKRVLKNSHTLRCHMKNVHADQEIQCDFCHKILKHEDTLQSHTRTFHPSQEVKCDKCDVTCESNHFLQKHLKKVHKKSEINKCKTCGKVMKTAKILRSHMVNYHSNKELKCDHCDSSFKSQRYLLRHTKRLVTCPQCPYRDNKINLPAHMLVVHLVKTENKSGRKADNNVDSKSQAKICKKVAERQNGGGEDIASLGNGGCMTSDIKIEDILKDSLAVANDEMETDNQECGQDELGPAMPNYIQINDQPDQKNKFSCPFCPKQFQRETKMKFHVSQFHRKDAKCPHCDFKTSCHLMLVHVRKEHLKQGKCEKCEFISVKKSELKRHVRIVHEKVRDYVCHFCGKGSGTISDLKVHINRLHEGEEKIITDEKNKRILQCELCGQECVGKRGLGRHKNHRHGIKNIDEEDIEEEEEKEEEKEGDEEDIDDETLNMIFG